MEFDLTRLQDFFPASDIEFRIGSTNKEKTKALALAYVTNRAIQKRLDNVVGIGNWKNDYRQWRNDSQLCGISIKIDGEWVTKWDGAEDTQTEPIKGGLSDSMKRAAVQWGIGRYLYEVPAQWYDIVQVGAKTFKFKTKPLLPAKFIPAGDKSKTVVDVATEEELKIMQILPEKRLIGDKELKKISECEKKYGLDLKKTLKWANIEKIEDMTKEQFNEFISILQATYHDVKFEITKAEDIAEQVKK